MRVIAGKYKRRNLQAPPGTEITRPTGDRVKESLFNIIASDLSDAIVLDLFSGSGALGIEALSRGAALVIFVESNKEALKFLKLNLSTLEISPKNVVIVESEVEKFLQNPGYFLRGSILAEQFAASINLIFADPPYASSWYDQAITGFAKSGLCADGCKAIIEMSQTRALDPHTPDAYWLRIDDRKYGKTKIEVWEFTTTEPDT